MSDIASTSRTNNISALTGAPIFFWIFALLSAMVAAIAGKALFPSEQLILALAIAAGTAALFKPQIALYGFLITVPLLSYKQNFGPVPVEPVTVGIFLIVVACIVQKIILKEGPAASDPHTVPLMLFIIASTVSLFMASDVVGGIAVVMRYAGYALLAVFVSRLVKGEKGLEGTFLLMVIVAAVSALMGLADYVYRPEQSIGLQGLGEEIQGRLAGTYENPNFFGEYLILIIPLGIALMMSKIDPLRRFLVAFLIFVSLMSLGLTYTRGSWIGLAIGLLVFAYLTKRWLVWIFIAGTSLLFFLPGFIARLVSSFDLSQGTAAFRLKLWQIPLQMISDHPFIGVGAGNYLNTFSDYVFKDPSISVGWVIYGAHNTFLAIAAESGLIGITAFLLIIASAARLALVTSKRTRGAGSDLAYYNAAIAASLAGYLFNNMTSNSLLHPRSAAIFWLLLGLQVVVARCSVNEETASFSGFRNAFSNSYLGQAIARLGSAITDSRSAIIVKPFYSLMLRGIQKSKLSEIAARSPKPPDVATGSYVWTPPMFLARGLSNMLSHPKIRDGYLEMNRVAYKYIILTTALAVMLVDVL